MTSHPQSKPASLQDIQSALQVSESLSGGATASLVGDWAESGSRWALEVALREGVFDFSVDRMAHGSLDRSTACVKALAKTLQNNDRVMFTHDLVFKPLSVSTPWRQVKESAQDISPFVESLATRLMADRAKLVGASASPNEVADADLALAGIMGLAAAMNLPGTVLAMGQELPHLQRTPLSSEWLGREFQDERLGTTSSLRVAPAFFAVFYSNNEALRAFAPPEMSLGKDASPALNASTPMLFEKAKGSDAWVERNAADMMACWHPSCRPDTLEAAWSKDFDPTQGVPVENRESIGRWAIMSMEREREIFAGDAFERYLPTLEAVGAFDFLPLEALKTALENGHPDRIERFAGRLPWEELDALGGEKTMIEMALDKVIRHGCKDEVDAALVALMRRSIQENQEGLFFKTRCVKNLALSDFMGESLLQPVCALIEGEHGRVLSGFLDHGLKKDEPMGHDSLSLTPFQFAQQVNAQFALYIMKSHELRTSADQAMKRLDDNSPRRRFLP